MVETPKAVGPSAFSIGQELEQATELLARNNHEIWARQRVADGWTYGPHRDDQAKKHPCLVDYDELPEAEKEYDRKTVRGVLEALVAHGYTIERSRR